MNDWTETDKLTERKRQIDRQRDRQTEKERQVDTLTDR